MPLTPLHAAFAYLAKKGIRRLSLPALLVGTMLPDLEIPVLYLLTGGLSTRLLLHSLLGAATVGVVLSVLLTAFLYPPIVSSVLRLEKNKVREACQFSSVLVLSALLGCLSHVLIDALSHEYNPLLYPFVHDSFDELVLFGNWKFASLVGHSVLIAIALLLFVRELNQGMEGFWQRVLVG
jgi:hypothetical protein